MALQLEDLYLAYEQNRVLNGLNLSIPREKFSVIIGPNGCGKSTLLKSLCRLLKPKSGKVLLNGQSIQHLATRQVAKQLSLLPQSAISPEGIKVAELVARGRYPHQGAFRQWTQADENAVKNALQMTETTELSQQMVDSLSGGQRQRVWIAMLLAQQAPILLLDEPTTYLDIAHQLELLELFKRLNVDGKHTIVAVLHDLNQACRYADNLIVMKAGKLVAEGPPSELITSQLIQEVFELDSVIIADPVTNTPLIVPKPPATGSRQQN
ncbi:ABC transporter ATP-binding protein [Agarivorans sp. QJM3NY_25]|uniref:ABC transporter ATP-binding protein n=1 Tax=Agarivorans sp. QJM3NY_25 TaxID=3421430 RepID=UPI003D7D65AA